MVNATALFSVTQLFLVGENDVGISIYYNILYNIVYKYTYLLIVKNCRCGK